MTDSSHFAPPRAVTDLQRACEHFRQALAPVCLRHNWLDAEEDLWPDQCQALARAVRAVQPAAHALHAALRGWTLPLELVGSVPTRLSEIERDLVEEAILHLAAVKAVCRSTRMDDLRLRRVAQRHLDTLIECGQAVLDDLWCWSVMPQGADRQRSGGVPSLRLVEANQMDAGQERSGHDAPV